MAKETTAEYAQRRANETGRAYLAGAIHALMDCPHNRAVFRDELCEKPVRYAPQRASKAKGA